MNASTPAEPVTEVPDAAERAHICHQDRMGDLECGIQVVLSICGINRPGVVRRLPSVEQIAADMVWLNQSLAEEGVTEPLADTCERLERSAKDLLRLLREVRGVIVRNGQQVH